MSRGCKKDHHHDTRMRGGRHYRCTTCHDVFPCNDCQHLDCIVATGRELPDNVGPETREALTVELTALYPDNAFAFAPLPIALSTTTATTVASTNQTDTDSAFDSGTQVPKLTAKQLTGLRLYARTSHWGDTHGKTIHSLERCGLIGFIDGVQQVTKLGHAIAGTVAEVSANRPAFDSPSTTAVVTSADSAPSSEPQVPKLTAKQIAGLRTYARTHHWGDTHGKTIHSLERCGLIGVINGVRQVTKLGHTALDTPNIFDDLFATKGA